MVVGWLTEIRERARRGSLERKGERAHSRVSDVLDGLVHPATSSNHHQPVRRHVRSAPTPSSDAHRSRVRLPRHALSALPPQLTALSPCSGSSFPPPPMNFPPPPFLPPLPPGWTEHRGESRHRSRGSWVAVTSGCTPRPHHLSPPRRRALSTRLTPYGQQPSRPTDSSLADSFVLTFTSRWRGPLLAQCRHGRLNLHPPRARRPASRVRLPSSSCSGKEEEEGEAQRQDTDPWDDVDSRQDDGRKCLLHGQGVEEKRVDDTGGDQGRSSFHQVSFIDPRDGS